MCNVKYKCKICSENFESEDFEDVEEMLWGHIQFCHDELFDEIQDMESPDIIEEYFT